MATRVLPFAVTIPANTPQANPFTEAIQLDGWEIERIDLDVPPGPAGLMGFQIYNNGVPWIPYGGGEWIIWDDAKDSYYLEEQPTGTGWAVVGYNTDVQYTHTVYLRFHVNPASTGATVDTTPTVTFVTSDTPTTEPVTL